MNEQQALLAAVAANPADDTVRLVYADYLDECGGEANAGRAEFIRVQIALARLPANDPEQARYRTRSDQLLWRWDLVWQRDMPAGFKHLSGYRRGFPYRAAAFASAFPAAADDTRTLLVEELELTVDVPPSRLREVVLHRLFLRLGSLTVCSDLPIGFGGARALADGEFRRLERLSLAQLGIGDLGVKALCESRGFPRLRHLGIRDNDIGDAGGRTLLESALIGKLTRLDLWGNPLSIEVRDLLHARARGV